MISAAIRTERRSILFLSRNEITVMNVRINGIASNNPYLKTVGFTTVSFPMGDRTCGLDIVVVVI